MITLTTGIIAIITVSLGGFFFASSLHHRRVRKYLLQELPADENISKETQKVFGVESAAVVGVSLFDVLFNTSKLDPFVLKGIEHLHHGENFENLGDLTSYLKSNIIDSDSGTKAWRQMIHKYKGYTGEEQGFEAIRQSGADIDVPTSATNPDFDAIINGEEFDFAITDNPSYVQAKLDSNPDIKVWTNREMADAFEDNPRVYVDPDLSSQEAFQATNEAFEGIADLGDFIDSIPVITLAISSVKNTIGVIKGRKNVTTAIEHTLLDTTGVGVGGWLGSEAGLALGLALAPVTGGASAVIIPAITTVIGSIIGILSGKSITNWFKERHLRTAVEDLKENAEKYCYLFLDRCGFILDKHKDSYVSKVTRFSYAKIESQNWFGRIFFPRTLTKFYSMAEANLLSEYKNTMEYFGELFKKINSLDAVESGLLVFNQGETILGNDNELVEMYNKLKKRIEVVEIEKKKLK